MPNDELTSAFDLPKFTYTRSQAIANGIIVDITADASKAGFKVR